MRRRETSWLRNICIKLSLCWPLPSIATGSLLPPSSASGGAGSGFPHLPRTSSFDFWIRATPRCSVGNSYTASTVLLYRETLPRSLLFLLLPHPALSSYLLSCLFLSPHFLHLILSPASHTLLSKFPYPFLSSSS
jgi:hypothetical protein